MSVLIVKRLDETNARIPTRGTPESAGLDLYASEACTLVPNGTAVVIGTGIAVELPRNTCGRIVPRSSLAVKHSIDVLAGLIDEDYRGEIKAVLINHGTESVEIKIGDRIAQFLVQSIEKPRVVEVSPSFNLQQTERGDGGFGSTGR